MFVAVPENYQSTKFKKSLNNTIKYLKQRISPKKIDSYRLNCGV
jgi:hypothetical protein